MLLAEDNEVNQELAIAILERRGCHVVLARNGREAVALWEREPFDLVLMDVQMPEMDGLRATSAIRELEKTRGIHTPIVAVTAHAMEGDRERCLAAGMDGYVSKPLRVGELFQVVAELLPRRETVAPAAALITSPRVPKDLEPALEAVGGDPALLGNIVLLFLEQCPMLTANIRTAIQAGDGETVVAAAHTLGGSLSVLSATGRWHAARRSSISAPARSRRTRGGLCRARTGTGGSAAAAGRVLGEIGAGASGVGARGAALRVRRLGD